MNPLTLLNKSPGSQEFKSNLKKFMACLVKPIQLPFLKEKTYSITCNNKQ